MADISQITITNASGTSTTYNVKDSTSNTLITNFINNVPIPASMGGTGISNYAYLRKYCFRGTTGSIYDVFGSNSPTTSNNSNNYPGKQIFSGNIANTGTFSCAALKDYRFAFVVISGVGAAIPIYRTYAEAANYRYNNLGFYTSVALYRYCISLTTAAAFTSITYRGSYHSRDWKTDRGNRNLLGIFGVF